jgi:hypothetical protein
MSDGISKMYEDINYYNELTSKFVEIKLGFSVNLNLEFSEIINLKCKKPVKIKVYHEEDINKNHYILFNDSNLDVRNFITSGNDKELGMWVYFVD